MTFFGRITTGPFNNVAVILHTEFLKIMHTDKSATQYQYSTTTTRYAFPQREMDSGP